MWRRAPGQMSWRSYSHKGATSRFPTKFNPVRSASNPKIQLPKGKLVYNPAPSAPNPYNTPAAFLPKDSSRKVKYDDKAYSVEDMPLLQPEPSKKYHLTEEDVIKIQELRNSDPEKWTRRALAKEFNCSEFFISLASEPRQDQKEEMDRRLQVIKSLWTENRARERRNRQRRRELWLRDGY
uniref:ARAD1C22462p n=1 Tax=Blastobotrys adeninivorans TaxID=409370 RepID=A0A060T6R9_BLAAD